ncbi:MAG: hypothetical protein GY720_23755 [bacterium]|nr:hypothetical protein [bacterium]
MALNRVDLEVVRRWVEESCAAQGVVVKVAEPEAVERAAALLQEGRSPRRPREQAADA